MEWWQPGLQRPWTEASCIASVPATGATFGSFHNGSCGSPLSVHGSTGIPALEPSQGESGRFPDRHGHGSPSRRLVTPFLRTSLSIVQGRCGAPRRACSSFELALGDANRHVRLKDCITSGGRCAAIRFNSCLGTVAGLLELDDCSALVGEPNSLLGLAGELVDHRKEHRRCPVITLYLRLRAVDLNSSTFQSLCHCGHVGRLCRVRLARGPGDAPITCQGEFSGVQTAGRTMMSHSISRTSSYKATRCDRSRTRGRRVAGKSAPEGDSYGVSQTHGLGFSREAGTGRPHGRRSA